MIINFYINKPSVAKAVQFTLKDTTAIFPSELGLLEQYLKDDVAISMPVGEAGNDAIWPITQIVFFQKVLDNTAKYWFPGKKHIS